MTTETPAGRYVRRRATCLAMRVTEHNLAEVAAWTGGHTWASSVVVPTMRLVDGWLTGEHPAHVGDWVARLGDGRYQVMSDDDFRVEWMAAR